ncbi:MAG: hypothetical protein IPK85_22090 [Gemmatimonadetes bacterium]|nr:hypothetical protein [Gemmatimonadota bacterium]
MLTLPSPLHPLFVHLPIALTLLIPAFAVGALVAIRRGTTPRRAWGITVALMAVLVGSSWAALKTGEREEEMVEDVVSESAIHGHEEAAEAFLLATGVVLLVGAAGLLNGRLGMVARGVATAGTLALVGAGWQVGHTGGTLAYREGAAGAYATADASGPRDGRPAPLASSNEGRSPERDDDRDDER